MITPKTSVALRGRYGLSQRELAKEAEVGISTVVAFERGQRMPRVENLRAIRKVFTDRGAIVGELSVAFETEDDFNDAI